MFSGNPVMGSITTVRMKRFPLSNQYWATVQTVSGGQISARLLDTDLPKLHVAGYDVSGWNIRKNRRIELAVPVEASFVFDGVVFALCEVFASDPIPAFEPEIPW